MLPLSHTGVCVDPEAGRLPSLEGALEVAWVFPHRRLAWPARPVDSEAGRRSCRCGRRCLHSHACYRCLGLVEGTLNQEDGGLP